MLIMLTFFRLFLEHCFDYRLSKKGRYEEESEGDEAGDQGQGSGTLLQVMNVDKIYYHDEEKRLSSLGEQMDKFLDYVKLEYFHNKAEFVLQDHNVTLKSIVTADFLAQSDGFSHQDEYGPVRDFVPWLDKLLGNQLEQIGVTGIPLLQDATVEDVNGAVAPATTGFNIVGMVKARCLNTVADKNYSNQSKFNNNGYNCNFWSGHQQFRSGRNGSRFCILDLGIGLPLDLQEPIHCATYQGSIDKLNTLDCVCEGGTHLKLTLWGDYSVKMTSFLGSKVNSEATIRGLHPVFLFQNLLNKRAHNTMGQVSYQLVTGNITGKSRITLLGWYSGAGENFTFVSGLVEDKLVKIA
jgi:hypothetical protein